MGLSEYLAKNYLTAEKPPKASKKKRKNKDNSAGLTIIDDDALDDRWKRRRGLGDDDDEEEEEFRRAALGQIGEDDADSPYVIAGRTTERRTTKANWKTLDSGSGSGPEKTKKRRGGDEEEEAADAILASAAAERRTDMDTTADDEAPVVANAETDKADEPPQMESGARAGLQTAAETAAFAEADRKREKEEARRTARQAKRQETVYRDASGRVIDISKKRAEAQRAAEEKELRAKEVLKGDVQKREEKVQDAALEQAKFMPVARHADDEELNKELKQAIRWEDPMAEYIAKKAGRKHKKKRRGTGSKGEGEEDEEELEEVQRPTFRGGSAPNRYGIRPGHRWDGVDRSNGFEEKWFAARSKKEVDMRLEIDSDIDED